MILMCSNWRKAFRCLAMLCSIGALSGPANAQDEKDQEPMQIAREGVMYVVGEYNEDKTSMQGQMYVEYKIPAQQTQPYPIVMIHGGNATGAHFLGSPDGGPGWAEYFVRQGYAVYIVDQVGRGRSGFFESYGATRAPTADRIQKIGSRPEEFDDQPFAKLHTQWSGGTKPGTPEFDQFFSSLVPDIADLTTLEKLNRSAGAKLLNEIGPVVLLTHSQSGFIAFGLANDVPDMIKASVVLEPSGPPFRDAQPVGSPDWWKVSDEKRPFGITNAPLTYDPPLADGKGLKSQAAERSGDGTLVQCWRQAEPVHKLPQMAKVPMLIVTAEASYHAGYDYCTSEFLTQAGVTHDFVELGKVGIHGNGHVMTIEKNNREIAAKINEWITSAVK